MRKYVHAGRERDLGQLTTHRVIELAQPVDSEKLAADFPGQVLLFALGMSILEFLFAIA